MTEQVAVTFDADGFRAWLDAPTKLRVPGTPSNRQNNPLLSAAYQRLDGEAGWIVEATLFALRGAPQPHPAVPAPWVYAPDVSDVRVWATAAAEGGPDGGLVGEVTVDGIRLSLGQLSEADLVPQIYDLLPGYEAAEHALTALSERVNAVAEQFRLAVKRGALDEHAGGRVFEGEVVEATPAWPQGDNGRAYSAYDSAAAAVDNDVNHPAHPTHW